MNFVSVQLQYLPDSAVCHGVEMHFYVSGIFRIV